MMTVVVAKIYHPLGIHKKRHDVHFFSIQFQLSKRILVLSSYSRYTVQNLIAHETSFKAVILSIISYAPIIVSARS